MAERWAQMLTYWRPFEGASEQLRQSFRLDGDTLVAEEPTAVGNLNYTPWRVIAHPLGWLEVMNGYGDHLYTPGVKLRDPGGTLLWEWSHPDLEPFTMDAAVDADGYVYAVTSIDHPVVAGEVGFDIYRIDPATGDGTHLATVWHSDLPEPITTDGDVIEGTSIALSADASVAYVLVSPETGWMEGEQVLVGIDLASGTLLWMLRLEREQSGYYYGPYNFYDSFNVRSVPGEDTCYVTYEAFHTASAWRWMRLARIEFPDGPGQKPTQAWTREPFSAEETDTHRLWQGMRDLVVTEDAVLVAVEQGSDTPAPARLILKYGHDGELLWAWGDDQVGEAAAIAANGLAVAAGVVFFSLEFGDQTERYPWQAGLGALDYGTGEFLELGLFPLDSLWNGPVAAVGEVVPPEPVEPDFIVNPATPPDTTSYDCAAPQVTAVDECAPVPVALTGAWCANPPPEYSDPAVPWPIPEPEPNEPGVFVMAHQPEAADENITWANSEGVITSDIASRYSVREMVAHGEGLVTFLATELDDNNVQGVGRWGPDGEVWWWELPESATVIGFITALALGADDATYFSARTGGGAIDVWRVEPDGSGGSKVLTVTTADTGGPLGTRLAGAESRGGDIYYVLASPATEMDNPILVGIDMEGYYVLFAQEVVPPEGQRPISTSNVSLKRLTNNHDLVAAFRTWDQDAAITSVLVTRLDFNSRPFEAPSVAWQERLFSASNTISGSACYLAVTSEAVVIGHVRLGTGSDKPDGAPVTCLEASDGSLRWRFVDTMECVNDQVVAVSGDRVLVQVFDEERFPGDEWPYGYGYVMLDLATGEEVTDGVFPYQTRFADACAAIHVEDEGPIIIS